MNLYLYISRANIIGHPYSQVNHPVQSDMCAHAPLLSSVRDPLLSLCTVVCGISGHQATFQPSNYKNGWGFFCCQNKQNKAAAEKLRCLRTGRWIEKTLTFSSWTRGGALQSNFSTLWNSSVTIKDLWSFTFREVAFVQDDTDLWSNSSRVWLDVGYGPPFTVIMVCTKVHYQQSEHNYKMKHCQVMSLTWVHLLQ